MRIFLIGAPGSGKGTQARLLSKRYHLIKISIGEILRELIHNKTSPEKKIKNLINKGKLVSDKTIIRIVKNRISQKDCMSGFILDGFPRTIGQAKIISKNEISVDYIFELKIPTKIIIERILKRKKDSLTPKKTYSLKNENLPHANNNFFFRKDDDEVIIKKRLQEYKKFTQPLKTYWNKNFKNKKIQFFEIDGTQTILNVYKDIKIILEKKT
ncbi:MAG: nucleoside monophosphate kinase [Buchnera aphidicola (Nurudea shiraii)]